MGRKVEAGGVTLTARTLSDPKLLGDIVPRLHYISFLFLSLFSRVNFIDSELSP